MAGGLLPNQPAACFWLGAQTASLRLPAWPMPCPPCSKAAAAQLGQQLWQQLQSQRYLGQQAAALMEPLQEGRAASPGAAPRGLATPWPSQLAACTGGPCPACQ